MAEREAQRRQYDYKAVRPLLLCHSHMQCCVICINRHNLVLAVYPALPAPTQQVIACPCRTPTSCSQPRLEHAMPRSPVASQSRCSGACVARWGTEFSTTSLRAMTSARRRLPKSGRLHLGGASLHSLRHDVALAWGHLQWHREISLAWLHLTRVHCGGAHQNGAKTSECFQQH